ncbi:M56 family metallopeptidase [Halpernia sp. GG3]
MIKNTVWISVFIEVLKIVTWFNPALYFYKIAIITNHEFLADENVLAKNFEIKLYQQLILEEISTYQNRNFTNQFNFNNTKKRFIMMTKPNSKFVTLKKVFTLPIFALMFILFVQKTYAENKTENISAKKISKIAFKSNDKKIVLDNAKKDEIIKTDTLKPKKQILEQKPEIATPAIPPTPPKAPKVETVKTNAEFPGGINAFRSGVASNFNTAVMTGKEGLVKSEIYFNIDENGKTSNFRAEGSNETFNKEAIRAVSTINSSQLWKPATEDEKPVKSVYKLPLTIKFAN